MDKRSILILIKGKDRTNVVSSYQLHDDICDITFTDTPDRFYSYQSRNVEILPLQERLDSALKVVTANGEPVHGFNEILDFGTYYRFVYANGSDIIQRKSDVILHEISPVDKQIDTLLKYFKETAEAISLVSEDNFNILQHQYAKISSVSNDTVLASYFNPQKNETVAMPNTTIYPFGLNRSQKLAVERALSSKISIIQGPPGTGKTQTILNIIANVVRSGQTIAVVSTSNAATHNIAERLDHKGVSFLTAFLGSRDNKENFLQEQTGTYPDMSTWDMAQSDQQKLAQETANLAKELNSMLHAKTRIAEIDQELLQLNPERHYFEKYYASYSDEPDAVETTISSQQLLTLWTAFEQHAQLHFLSKFFAVFYAIKLFSNKSKSSFIALKLFFRSPELFIPYLQNLFYAAKKQELKCEKQDLIQSLEDYAFDAKMNELTQKSLQIFRAELAKRYSWKGNRRKFSQSDFRSVSKEFVREYPIILSTTYSIKNTLDKSFVYDYLVVDEASQVDLATGVLAFSCARNVVIVGDLNQLPNVLNKNTICVSDAIWEKYTLNERYHFSSHNLLSSALETWVDAPVTLLREHYRCHPKIINFCNQKFYHGQLIVMTQDCNESDVLSLYQTVPGSHAREHYNQRQIDVIQQDVLPRLSQQHFQSIGIIAPYNEQVNKIRKQFGKTYDVGTIHSFQGREKDAIILSSVDNAITRACSH